MADSLGGLLLLIGIGTLAFFIVKYAVAQSKAIDETYQKVARRFGGSSVPGGVFGRPVLRFRFAGGPAKVDIYSTGGKHARYYTQLHLVWPDSELRCEVYPEQFLHGVGKMLGMDDIQIGSREFDQRFFIRGNSEEAVRRLLSDEVQLAIEKLRTFLGNDDIFVSVRGSGLLIKKRTLIRDENTLIRFIRLGIGLHEAASRTNAVGIDFVNAEQTEATISLASACCQVCGDEISDDAVFCRSCKTPHHQDCWQYYGSCSTYGCGQTKFLVLKQGRRSERRETKDHT